MRPQRGFTLIEVLAALAVLGLALGASLTASTFYAGSTRDLEDRMLAGWLAHNLMVEAQLEESWPELDRKSRDYEHAGQSWTVQRTVEETPDEFLRRITIRVRRERDEEGWLLTRTAFLAEPVAPLPESLQPGAPGTPGTGAQVGPGREGGVGVGP